MKLVRFGPPAEERPGLWLDNLIAPGKACILDVRGMAFDIEDYNGRFFTHWGTRRVEALLHEPGRKLIPAEGVRLGPPVAHPTKIICLGANYADHAAEFGAEIPEFPILFSKAGSALIGPFDTIILPSDSKVVDSEVELAVVIGQKAHRVNEADALKFVAGYTLLNDVTDREAQRRDKQWFRAKSFDTFCPLGPFLVTADEIPDPHALRLYSKVNGTILQDSNTAQMIFRIPRLISYISATITLEPGDIIATGTPRGIGSVRKPPILLKPGDTVELGAEKIGVQICPVRAQK